LSKRIFTLVTLHEPAYDERSFDLLQIAKKLECRLILAYNIDTLHQVTSESSNNDHGLVCFFPCQLHIEKSVKTKQINDIVPSSSASKIISKKR
jgi:hypothetical protein